MIKSLIHSMIVCPDMEKEYPKISYGKGVYLFDDTGKKYLDASSGSAAVSNIGHGNLEIAEIIKEQISKIAILPTHAFSSEIVENYLDKLIDFTPDGFSKAWTCMSGTEGVENSVKLALQYHQLRGDKKRFKIISRWNTYHGSSVFTLDIGGMKYRRQSYEQWMNNFPHVSPAYKYRNAKGLSDEEYTKILVDEFEESLLKTDPYTVAAFIAEPVVAAAMGAVPPPKGYFEQIYSICSKYGILFISDEILTGFGRTGEKFGFENFNIKPDIIAVGKGISGGYFPLSGIIANDKIMEPFVQNNSPFLGGHTFSCNPVGAAVGKFVLEYIENNNVVKNSNEMGLLFKNKLERLKKFDIVGDIRGVGLLCGIEFVKNKVSKEPFSPELNISKKIGNKALKKGVVLYPGKGSIDGILGDHIMITPPLIVNSQHLDIIVDVLEDCIIEIQNELV